MFSRGGRGGKKRSVPQRKNFSPRPLRNHCARCVKPGIVKSNHENIIK